MPTTSSAFSKRSAHRLSLIMNSSSSSATQTTYNYNATMVTSNNTLKPFASGLLWKIEVYSGGSLVTSKGSGSYSYDFRTGSTNATKAITPGSGSFTINRPASGSSGITYEFRFTANTANAGAELIGIASSSQTFTTAAQDPPPTPAPSWSTASRTDNATVGTTFSRTYTATGINSSNAYSLASGSFPNSLSLNTTSGTVSGTVAAGADQSFTFRLNATGAGGTTQSPSYTISRIQSAPVWTTTSFTEIARVGEEYSKQLSATSADSYSLASGSLPSGITLSSAGSLSGTPSAGTSQAFDFTVSATGTGGSTTSQSFRLNRRQPLPVWSNETLSAAGRKVGVFYSDSVVATNASSYSATGLPQNGLSHSGGTVSGTPTSTNQIFFDITASNSDGDTLTKSFSFTAQPAAPVWVDQTLATTTIKAGQSYSDGVSATNTTSYSLFSGTLPPGITLDANTGVLSGVPTTADVQPYTFVLRATNSANESISTNTLSITVQPAGSGKVWNGSAWVLAPFKVWSGSAWIEAQAKVWNGSIWADPVS